MPVDTDYTSASNKINDYTYKGNSQTDQTNKTGEAIDAVFADPEDQQVSIDDFLQLMIAQLKNQDFMNPVDDTQYVTQLAQFTTMQQMEELAYNSKSTYITSMVGKYATAAKMTVSGDLDKTTGIVNKISLVDNEYLVYVNDKPYKLSEIMEVQTPPAENAGSAENTGSANNGDDKNSGNDSKNDGE